MRWKVRHRAVISETGINGILILWLLSADSMAFGMNYESRHSKSEEEVAFLHSLIYIFNIPLHIHPAYRFKLRKKF